MPEAAESKENSSKTATISGWAFFLLPEDRVSLKLVFDNLRNYIICSALFLAVVYSESMTQFTEAQYRYNAVAVVGLVVIASLAFLQNFLQTVELAERGRTQFNLYLRERYKGGGLLRRGQAFLFSFALGALLYTLMFSTVVSGGVLAVRQVNEILLNQKNCEGCGKAIEPTLLLPHDVAPEANYQRGDA